MRRLCIALAVYWAKSYSSGLNCLVKLASPSFFGTLIIIISTARRSHLHTTNRYQARTSKKKKKKGSLFSIQEHHSFLFLCVRFLFWMLQLPKSISKRLFFSIAPWTSWVSFFTGADIHSTTLHCYCWAFAPTHYCLMLLFIARRFVVCTLHRSHHSFRGLWLCLLGLFTLMPMGTVSLFFI